MHLTTLLGSSSTAPGLVFLMRKEREKKNLFYSRELMRVRGGKREVGGGGALKERQKGREDSPSKDK